MQSIFSHNYPRYPNEAPQFSVQPRDMDEYFPLQTPPQPTPIFQFSQQLSPSQQPPIKQKQYHKTSWDPYQDQLLIKAVQKYGTKNWTAVAREIEGRNGKQCRERYIGHLDPTLNKDEWTPEEDEKLLHLHKQKGNKWADIARQLPGRAPIAVKNRYSWLNNRSLKEARSMPNSATESLSFPEQITGSFGGFPHSFTEPQSEANDDYLDFESHFDNAWAELF